MNARDQCQRMEVDGKGNALMIEFSTITLYLFILERREEFSQTNELHFQFWLFIL